MTRNLESIEIRMMPASGGLWNLQLVLTADGISKVLINESPFTLMTYVVDFRSGRGVSFADWPDDAFFPFLHSGARDTYEGP